MTHLEIESRVLFVRDEDMAEKNVVESEARLRPSESGLETMTNLEYYNISYFHLEELNDINRDHSSTHLF